MIDVIVPISQVAFLLLTSFKLMSFRRDGGMYRPFVSLLATLWAGTGMALAVSITTKWPESVGPLEFVQSFASGVLCAAAFWCGGNVAELLRRLGIDYH